MLACSASEQSDLSVCPHLLLSSATQKCLGALLHPKMPLLQLFPIKALQEGCSKTNCPLSAFHGKKESTWDVLFKPPVRIFHRSCVKREGEETHKMTFLGISIVCFGALQWNTWMEGLFCRRGGMTNANSLFQGLCWVEGL